MQTENLEALKPALKQSVAEVLNELGIPPEPIYPEPQVAKRIGMKVTTLRAERQLGRIGYMRLANRRVYYSESDIQKYLALCRKIAESEEKVAPRPFPEQRREMAAT